MHDRTTRTGLLDQTDRQTDRDDPELRTASEGSGAPNHSNALSSRMEGVRVGTLVAITNGAAPLVVFEGQSDFAARPARATLDLHTHHIGREVVLMFEEGDPNRPIVIGCLRGTSDERLPAIPGDQVEVDLDGQRMVVSAKEQLVLRCGKASITLTRAGKVLIQGAYVASRSSGALRLKGGSVHIN